MLTRDDFKPSLPTSLKEIVVDELIASSYDNWQQGKEVEQITDESIEQLMQKVYAHIEKQALEVYKSNEPWALKAWVYSTILKDTVASAANDSIAAGLISPIEEWQKTDFDPLDHFKKKLEAGDYSSHYIDCCKKVAGNFIAKAGKKPRYSSVEILDYLDFLKQTYPNKASYATFVHRFKSFIDSLPEDEEYGKKQVWPLKRMPKYPYEYHRPAFSPSELESMAAAAILEESPQSILRLLLAQVYGLRLEELGRVESRNINCEKSEITFYVSKRRTAEPMPITQPIPKSLLPFFAIPLESRDRVQVLRDLKRIAKKAGVPWPWRGGVHSIRRQVVTALWNTPELKELTIRRFLRWSTATLGVMPGYVQKPPEVTDSEVLAIHPFIKWWELFARYIPWLPQYQPYVGGMNTFVVR